MENVNRYSNSQEETIPLTHQSQADENPNLSEDLLETAGVDDNETEINESETTTQLVSPLVETQIDKDPGNTSESSIELVNGGINPTGRGCKRKRRSKFSSLDVELLNSSKAVELLLSAEEPVATDDTSKSGLSETSDGAASKRRRRRKTSETTEYGTYSSSSSSHEEPGNKRNRGKKLTNKDLRNKLAIKRLNKLWPGFNKNEDTESIRSGESSDQHFTDNNEEFARHTGVEDGLTGLDDNYNESPAGDIIQAANIPHPPPFLGNRGTQPQRSSTPFAMRTNKNRNSQNGRDNIEMCDMDERRAQGGNMTGNDDLMRKEIEELRLDLERTKNENKELKRRAEANYRKTQHPTRSYLVPREDLSGRMDNSIFKTFLDLKHKKDKVGEVTVDPVNGNIGGYGKEVEALFEDAKHRSRNVAEMMSIQIVTEKDEKLLNNINDAMEAMLKVVDTEGRRNEKEDKVSFAQMGEFVRRVFTKSFEADMDAITQNQIATVEAIATDLHETQKESVRMGTQIDANQKRIKKIEEETVSEEEMLRCINDEKQKDSTIIIRNYPKIAEINKIRNMEGKKKMICDDLNEFNDASFTLDTDQIAAVFPSRVPESNKQMRRNGKGTLKIIFRQKMSGFYLRKFSGKYPNKSAPFGQIVEYITRVEMRVQKRYYKYVDEVAKETKNHIVKEFGNVLNFETSLNSDATRTINRLAQYEIKIANRRGKHGTSEGPNVQTIRKPEASGAGEVHKGVKDAFYSQMETSLKRTVNSLKRSESRRNQRETGSGGTTQ